MEQLHYKKIEVAQELIAERDSLATNLQQMLVVMTNIETWISTNPSVAAHLEQPKLKLAVGVAETSNLVSNYTQKIEKLEGQYADDENQQNRFQEETTRLATKLG